jgi:hypothetical protein
MICPVIILILSLALVLSMSGLYFLAYIRREGLGWLSRTVGYLTVGFGLVVFIIGITTVVLKREYRSCRKHTCSKHMEHSCRMNNTCCRSCYIESMKHGVKVYRYSTKGDSLKGDKTIVRKEIEVIPR